MKREKEKKDKRKNMYVIRRQKKNYMEISEKKNYELCLFVMV